jgi:hypothetical protein
MNDENTVKGGVMQNKDQPMEIADVYTISLPGV